MYYLEVATNKTGSFTNVVLYAAEADGSVLAYRQQTNNTNLFIPTLGDNPDLDNNNIAGIGSTANLFNGSILCSQAGTNTFYSSRVVEAMSSRPLTHWAMSSPTSIVMDSTASKLPQVRPQRR